MTWAGKAAAFVARARHPGVNEMTAGNPLYSAVHADFPEIMPLRQWPHVGSP